MSLPCVEESRMQNKVNRGKIGLWLWSVSYPRFLACIVRRSNTKCYPWFGPGLVIYKRCTKPHCSECCWCGWRWEECFYLLTAHGLYPFLIPKTFWSWWLSKPFSAGSLPFSDCCSDISHPSHVSLSSSGQWGEVCLEVIGSVTSAYTGCSWTRLKTMLFICSAFSCLLHLLSLPRCWNRLLNLFPLLSVCIWPYGDPPAHTDGSWLCLAVCVKQLFSYFSSCRNISASAKHSNKAWLLHPPAYPVAGKTVPSFCGSFLLPFWQQKLWFKPSWQLSITPHSLVGWGENGKTCELRTVY